MRRGGHEGPNAQPAGSSSPAVEVSLVALSLSAVAGLTYLFTSNSYLPATLTSVFCGHLVAMTTRRLRLSVPATLLCGAAGLGVAISWLVLPSTTFLGLPTTATLTQAADELSRAWQTFRIVAAPAPVLPGFILAVVVVGWLIAFVADIAAFRANAPVEAAAPAAALFAFGGVLGQSSQLGTHRITTTAFLVSLGSYWLSQSAFSQGPVPSSGQGQATVPRSLLSTGGMLGALSVVVAILVGPSLPGMDEKAIIPWRDADRDDPGSRVTISPLVDIRTRMVDQSNLEVFSVRSEARSYWRLTSLERFDGQIWSSEGRYRKASGELPSAAGPTEPTANRTVTQNFTIAELSSIWLPAAFRPIAVKGASLRYDPTSASLLSERPTSKGQTYEVTSTLTSLSPEALETSPPATPSAITTTYLKLPENFSPRLRNLAEQVVAPAATAYDRARLLQDWFRTNFTYDLEVPPGHAGDVLERFVFETRRGYCEQFAGTYAAMARAVGLPSRVAVGFTPGEQASDGRYVVRGANGHAWPEVHLAGYGWVPFEPTPGRGIPNAEAYTGVPEQQAAPNLPGSATTLPAATTSTIAPNGTADSTASPTSIAAPAPTEAEKAPPWWTRVLIILAVLVLLVGLWIACVAAGHQWRRRRRRARARDATDQVLIAWDETGEALARLGVGPLPSETPSEYALRVAASIPVGATDLIDLATLATAARYRPPMPHAGLGSDDGPGAEAQRAQATGEQIRRQVTAMLSTADRARLLVDPRTSPASSSRSRTSKANRSRSNDYSSRLNRS